MTADVNNFIYNGNCCWSLVLTIPFMKIKFAGYEYQ